MITYNKYINNEDHTWYDSTNVVYSKCYNNNQQTKTLKIVFGNGRTYVYRDVDVNDYVAFKMAESNGKSVNTFIVKKYKGVRIADTDVEKLNVLKEEFDNTDKENGETKFENLSYHLDMCEATGEFVLKLNDKPIYNGIEGQVSIINLLKSMNIKYSWQAVNIIEKDSDEMLDEIKIN